MRRDWQAIKKILLKLEEFESLEQYLTPDMIDGVHPAVVDYHVRLLNDAGLIEADIGLNPCAMRLRWQGHEFLDTIRDDRLWSQIVRVARQKGLELSFEAIKAIASGIIRGVVG